MCQLTVQPTGTVFTRSLGDNIVFTCSLNLPAGSVIVNIQWMDQDHIEILDKSPGRDKYDATVLFIASAKKIPVHCNLSNLSYTA